MFGTTLFHRADGRGFRPGRHSLSQEYWRSSIIATWSWHGQIASKTFSRSMMESMLAANS